MKSNTAKPLKRMFDGVPHRYDLLNRLLTLSLDERWRGLAAARLLENGARRVLDMCTGTGDLAFGVAKRIDSAADITGLDFSAPMLEAAREKAGKAPDGKPVLFVEGNAAEMEFEDEAFDAVGVAFGFRNVSWRNPLLEPILAEVRRVLRPGGRFVIVETSQPANPLLRAGFHAYLKMVVAPFGTLISGHRAAYRYLAKSACNYYTAADVATLLEKAGFADVGVELLMGGVAAIHVATKGTLPGKITKPYWGAGGNSTATR
jgi:demethylmenaquinone methyltransferase / 2-methoxy-6-polyprenyl-1,4-benzoquinol methylase